MSTTVEVATRPSVDSQSIARPQRARFQRGDDVLRQAGPLPCSVAALADAGDPPPEQAALRGDQRRSHLLAEALAQDRLQIAEPVGQPELERLVAGPEFAGK